MSRKRMIDPGIWTDDGFLSLPRDARLLFIGMISHADDDGRGCAESRALKAKVFPSDELSEADVAALCTSIAHNMRVQFYEVEGKRYYQLSRWNNHQFIKDRKPSTLPGPTPDRERTDAGPTPDRERRPMNERKKEKKEYAKGVTFTDSEYENMCAKHGKGVVDAAAEILSAYKEAHGKEYKSDAGALREWALGEAVKRGAKRGSGPPALDIRKCPKGHEYLAGTTCRVCGWKEGESDS